MCYDNPARGAVIGEIALAIALTRREGALGKADIIQDQLAVAQACLQAGLQLVLVVGLQLPTPVGVVYKDLGYDALFLAL